MVTQQGTGLSIGIVVPVFNEAPLLPQALRELERVVHTAEVLVVDGGSSDGTVAVASACFRTIRNEEANRGSQMNLGARTIDCDVLLFLHADSQLPAGFETRIREALRDPSIAGGCFRLGFDARSPLLNFYSWCTRFRGRFLHFVDQGFFVRRSVFEAMGGFRNLEFLEDVDFLRRLRRHGKFVVVPAEIVTSARRFLRFGVARQQLLNILIVILFEIGVSPRSLARLYPPVR